MCDGGDRILGPVCAAAVRADGAKPAGRGPLAARRTGASLDQCACLRQLVFDWLDRYDEAALDDADALVTSHEEGTYTEQAARDLSVYLCNWVVMNSPEAQWFLDPRAGICFVGLPGRQSLLNLYRHIVKCLSGRLLVAHRFVEGPPPSGRVTGQ